MSDDNKITMKNKNIIISSGTFNKAREALKEQLDKLKEKLFNYNAQFRQIHFKCAAKLFKGGNALLYICTLVELKTRSIKKILSDNGRQVYH